MPTQKKNTGRNIGIGVGAAVVVGGIVAAVALSGGGKKPGPDPSPTATGVTGSSGTATSQPTNTSGSPSATSGVDPATWDNASTDTTPLSGDALLPISFTDSKGVVYTATNRWTDTCVNSFESPQLKATLTKYKCDKQAIATYTDSEGRILVDIAVLPLPDAASAQNAFKEMQNNKAFIFKDWGVWCPSTGTGSEICAAKKDTSGAQQYGYIQPNHRYLIHAVSVFVNLTGADSAKDWLTPAATSAAKQAGPQVAAQ